VPRFRVSGIEEAPDFRGEFEAGPKRDLGRAAKILGAIRSESKSLMAKTNPAQFVRQVRQEVSKVTWPTRKETGVATLMVFIMVAIMMLFFLAVDGIIAWLVELILGR
jgi:preprotein translocase subunit SecE